MRVVISKHAQVKFKERTTIREDKYQKVAEKAWISEQDGWKLLKYRLYKQGFKADKSALIKGFNGKIYIFVATQRNSGEVIALLKTIY